MSVVPEPVSHDWADRIKLAIIATAGSLFAYVSPSIVSGLISEFGFGGYDAGLIVSANTVGTGVGGVFSIMLARSTRWREICGGALLFVAMADLSSTLASLHQSMLIIRFFHGVAAGTLIGLTFAAIARHGRPERTLAIYLFLQLSIAGMLMLVGVSPIFENISADPYWIALCLVSIFAFAVLSRIATGTAPPELASNVVVKRAGLRVIALMMLGIVVYQAGEVAVYAFVIEIGLYRGFRFADASNAVAASLLIGAPVALAASWRTDKTRYLAPTILSTVAMAMALAVFLLPSYIFYVAANVLFSVFFCMSCAYMFGVAAKLDNIGQIAAAASFASTIGESLGPALGGIIIDGTSYRVLIVFGVCAAILAAALFVKPSRDVDKGIILRLS